MQVAQHCCGVQVGDTFTMLQFPEEPSGIVVAARHLSVDVMFRGGAGLVLWSKASVEYVLKAHEWRHTPAIPAHIRLPSGA